MTSISHAGAPVHAIKADAPANDTPIEPATELPKAEPWKPGVGTYLGAAGLGVLGLGVGTGVGGIIGLASSMSAGGQGNGGLIIMGGLALAGLAAGVAGAFMISKNSHESSERERIQSNFGTSTLEYSRGMIHQFDHNANGQIDLENSTGLASMDERVFSEERRQSRSHPKYDIWNDEWRTETERWTETRGTSAAGVWSAADVDPTDKVVKDVELARLMSQYDSDRNGALTTPEQEAFKQAHPVIVEDWQR